MTNSLVTKQVSWAEASKIGWIAKKMMNGVK